MFYMQMTQGKFPSTAERASKREREGTELEMMVSVWGLGVRGEEVCKVGGGGDIDDGEWYRHATSRLMCRTTSFLFDAVGTLCSAVSTAHDPVSDLGERGLKGEWDGPDAFILQSVPPLSFLISFKRPQNPKASLSLISGRRST